MNENETLSKEEKLARLRLSRCDLVGSLRFWEFINTYGSAIKAISAISKFPQGAIKLCEWFVSDGRYARSARMLLEA